MSPYTNTRPPSPTADLIFFKNYLLAPGVRQGCHSSTDFQVTGMTPPRRLQTPEIDSGQMVTYLPQVQLEVTFKRSVRPIGALPRFSRVSPTSLEAVLMSGWLNTDRSRTWGMERRRFLSPCPFTQAISAVILWLNYLKPSGTSVEVRV